MELILLLIAGSIVACFASGVGRTYGHRIGRCFEQKTQRLAADRHRQER